VTEAGSARHDGLDWAAGLRAAWRLARPFWRRDGRARWQLAGLVALTLVTVWINVRLSAWNAAFYDALQAHRVDAFWRQLAVFGALAAFYIAVAVARLVVQQRLVMRWRAALTDSLLGRWLAPGTPYRLAQALPDGIAVDNPDQRVAEDARNFTAATLDLALGLLNAGVTLVSFVAILWTLSGTVDLPAPLDGWQLHGGMVWAALVYSLVGSLLVRRIGAPLVPATVAQQRVEADFRYALVQVRDHAEAIALQRGEGAERRRIADRFEAVRANWEQLIGCTKRLTLFNAGYAQLASVFPLLAAAPRYFAGAMQLGGLMQTAQAFGQVQGALGWFVDAYAGLAEWRAGVARLAAFEAALATADAGAAARAVEAPHDAAVGLAASGLVVAPPHGAPLLGPASLELRRGRWLLVTGPSGRGKTALLRTLAGLWPPRRGEVRRDDDTMVLPQRPHVGEGTLAELLAYPHPPGRFDRLAMRAALAAAELAAFAHELDARAAWAQRLSPGEQQRLQFARVLLQRPRVLLMDESTSALDEALQLRLLQRLRSALPQTAVLAVGHRRELQPLHDEVLALPEADPRGVLHAA